MRKLKKMYWRERKVTELETICWNLIQTSIHYHTSLKLRIMKLGNCFFMICLLQEVQTVF